MTDITSPQRADSQSIYLFSGLMSAESYAVYKVVSKAVDQVFQLNYAEGKNISEEEDDSMHLPG